MPQVNSDVHSFPSLPPDFQDAAALIQKQFKESIASLDSRIEELEVEHKNRKTIAIILKILSVLSSLIVLSGVANDLLVQVLGGLITGIAALERVFANMSRLLAVAAAISAYQRVRMQVVNTHNREIIEVVKFRNRDPQKSANTLITFVGLLRDQLAKIKENVESNLRENAYENLGRLVLDDPKSGTS